MLRSVETSDLRVLNDTCGWLANVLRLDWNLYGATTKSAQRRLVVRAVMETTMTVSSREAPNSHLTALLRLVPEPFVQRLRSYMAISMSKDTAVAPGDRAARSSLMLPPPPPPPPPRLRDSCESFPRPTTRIHASTPPDAAEKQASLSGEGLGDRRLAPSSPPTSSVDDESSSTWGEDLPPASTESEEESADPGFQPDFGEDEHEIDVVAVDPATLPLAALPGRPLAWEEMPKQWPAAFARAAAPRALQWPYEGPVAPQMIYVPYGYWPWNARRKRRTAFRNRIQGPWGPVTWLQGGNETLVHQFLQAGGTVARSGPALAHDEEVSIILQWLHAREGMKPVVTGVEVVPPLTDSLGPGSWVRVKLVHRERTLQGQLMNATGWHGTSMNNLYRVVVQGLAMGWSAIREDSCDAVDGIYMHGPQSPQYCGTYVVYSPLQDAGYLWAPFLEVRYVSPDPLGRKNTAKRKKAATQYVTYKDCSCIASIYFHVMHVSQTCSGKRDLWYNVEPMRPREMEIPPEEAEQEIIRRSQYRWESWAAGMRRRGLGKLLEGE